MLEARCPKHPDEVAQGTCLRCGTFVCRLDFKLVQAKTFCETCAALPEINYLEAFRLEYWGKRDGWAWLFGLSAIGNFLSGAATLLAREWVAGAVSIGLSGFFVAYFLGQRWTRVALLLLPLVSVVLVAVATSSRPGSDPGQILGGACGVMFLPFLFSLAIFNDTRNRLFFKVEVSEAKLRALWDLHRNNIIARQGFLLSLMGLAIFPLAPFALVLSVLGLRRVNLNAIPPVGRRGQAIAGIVLSVVGLLLGAAILVNALR